MKSSKAKVLSVIVMAIILLGSSGIPAVAHTHHDMDFYEIFETNGTIMLLIDGETGDIIHVNRTAGEFYGYSVAQLESMNMSQINNIPKEEIERRAAAAAKAHSSSFILEQTTANGEQRIVEAYVCPHEQDGDVVLFATLFDITDKVRLEKRHRLVRNVLIASLLAGTVFLVLFLITLERHNKNLRKQNERIKYLSFHDPLTGLYNRTYYEKEIAKLDASGKLPLSVVMADVNGLKLTNDIFGHKAGDLLLKKAAETFQKVIGEEDIIARIGGDEFVILMPNTGMHAAEVLVEHVKNLFGQEKIMAIKGSISMGVDTRVDEEDDIHQVISNAELKMYARKTLERGQVKETAINSIVEMLHKDNPEEERHAKSVSRISAELGRALHLSEEDIRKLKEAGWLHDIGKVTLDKSLLNIHSKPSDKLSEEQIRKIRQHPVVGYRILNSFDETLDIAGLILAHHEYWDGSGYPKGLKGEEIPLLARIIAAAEYYDTLLQRTTDCEKIAEELMVQSGKRLDPQLVSILLDIYLPQERCL